MKRLTLILFIFTYGVFGAFSLSGDAHVNIAVVSFENQTESDGLGYLSSSLADSLSTILSRIENINIIEREHMEKILAEMNLQLSGLIKEGELSSVGKLAQADVLILGSYSGEPEKLVVNLKAVEVSTGKVLYGRVITAPLSTLFDLVTQASLEVGTIASGMKVAILSVTTIPDGCDIYINGMLAGKSPLVEYKIPPGQIRLKAVKTGYREENSTITAVADTLSLWKINLREAQNKYPWHAAVSVFFRNPLSIPSKKDLFMPGLFMLVSWGYSFSDFTLAAELGYSRMNHSVIIDFFGTPVEQERWYDYSSLDLNLTYIPFPDWKYMVPQIGLFVGGAVFNDIRKNSSADSDTEKLLQQEVLLLGTTVCIDFFPFSRFHPYLEGRFHYFPQKIDREAYSSPGLSGGLTATPESYTFFGFSIGGGIKVVY